MSFVKKIIICYCIGCFVSSVAYARKATEEEMQSLKTTAASYATALQTSDYDAILSAIPPQIMTNLARQSKIDDEKFKQFMTSQMQKMGQSYKVDQVKISEDKKRAGELDNGNPYFILPIEFIMTSNGQEKNRIKGELVALIDNDKWYLVRGDDATTLEMMKTAFPGFEKIKLSVPEVKKLN